MAERFCPYCRKTKPEAEFVRLVVRGGKQVMYKCKHCDSMSKAPVEVREAHGQKMRDEIRAKASRLQKMRKGSNDT